MADELTRIDTGVNNEMLKLEVDLGYYPITIEEQGNLAKQAKVPLSKISALGTAFEPLTQVFQKIVSEGKGGSGLYRVTVPEGRSLAKFRDGRGYLGSVLTEKGTVGGGQAILNPIEFNPAMLFMATTLVSIDKKLDTIQEIQEEIFSFLIQKERSELKGDLRFLNDILNNFKYNWFNEKYKNSSHIKVLDIKQASEGKIDFYRERIKSKLDKRSFLQTDKKIEKQGGEIESELKDYQLALYLYAFSSFIEVLLLENYDPAYLDNVILKIGDYSFDYRDIYTRCYLELDGNIKSTIENKLSKGIGDFSIFAGETIAKAPIINKSKVDKKLIATGDKLGKYRSKKTTHIMQSLIEKQDTYVRPFVENLNKINDLYNKPIELSFDKENIYIGVQ